MNSYTLTNSQLEAEEAIISFLGSDEKYFLLTGSYGTGKSFFTKHFVDNINEYALRLPMSKQNILHNIYYTATTKDAVNVLSEFSGKECKTIHSLLRLFPKWKKGETYLERRDRDKPNFYPIILHNSLILIDESSFTGLELFNLMEEAIADSCKVILIGDKYQLKPIDEEPIIDTLECPSYEMTDVKRNAGHLLQECIKLREMVKTGVFKPISCDGISVVHMGKDEFTNYVQETYKFEEDKDFKNIKVISYTNANVNSYNNYIRKFNDTSIPLQVGETVLVNRTVIVNKSVVFNTSTFTTILNIIDKKETKYNVLGRYVQLDGSDLYYFQPDSYEDMERASNYCAKTRDWNRLYEIKEQWLDIRPGYASTTHKMQGKTVEEVAIDLNNFNKCIDPDTVARLIYVGMSRASKRVILYGSLRPEYGGTPINI